MASATLPALAGRAVSPRRRVLLLGAVGRKSRLTLMIEDGAGLAERLLTRARDCAARLVPRRPAAPTVAAVRGRWAAAGERVPPESPWAGFTAGVRRNAGFWRGGRRGVGTVTSAPPAQTRTGRDGRVWSNHGFRPSPWRTGLSAV